MFCANLALLQSAKNAASATATPSAAGGSSGRVLHRILPKSRLLRFLVLTGMAGTVCNTALLCSSFIINYPYSLAEDEREAEATNVGWVGGWWKSGLDEEHRQCVRAVYRLLSFDFGVSGELDGCNEKGGNEGRPSWNVFTRFLPHSTFEDQLFCFRSLEEIKDGWWFLNKFFDVSETTVDAMAIYRQADQPNSSAAAGAGKPGAMASSATAQDAFDDPTETVLYLYLTTKASPLFCRSFFDFTFRSTAVVTTTQQLWVKRTPWRSGDGYDADNTPWNTRTSGGRYFVTAGTTSTRRIKHVEHRWFNGLLFSATTVPMWGAFGDAARQWNAFLMSLCFHGPAVNFSPPQVGAPST